ncbi:glycosyl hydrolase [Amycolatopsis vastitatis]|uniref:glycosyl hydrolase n=1 Tax=Amycolatopsis vastitatis TaxID=1905142 RepID=UPI001F0A2619|nr:glycosyl hydrolase [Amycolatopsis vastitatis]
MSLVAVGVLAALTMVPAAAAGPEPDASIAGTDSLQTLAGGLSPTQFAHPDNHFKPAMRWWWQKPLDDTEALRELQVIADAGFGEIEIAFSAGAWATDEQRTILGHVLDKAAQLGIKISMTMGAAWPVQTPSTGAGSGFASQELQYGRVHLTGGQSFSGPVTPPIDAAQLPQARKLVAVTAARVVDAGPDVTTPGQPPAKSTVLDPASLTDLTAQVKDGNLTWRAPDGGNWDLFAFWSRENKGNYTNPFDADASRKAAQDLDQIQIGQDNAPKLRKAGADLFEDSLELHGTSIFWTPKMESEFRGRRGYDMAKYLPLMFVQGESDFPVPPKEPNADFALSDGSAGKIRHDYYETLTDLYIGNHLQVFQDWAKQYGMQYKAQAAYLQDLEPIRSFRSLQSFGARSETESLDAGENLPISTDDPAWRNSLAFQQTIASSVHQTGGDLLSVELGAFFKPAYSMNLDNYRDLMGKEWAAGVSQPFIHGFALQTAGAAWPGTTRFGETVTDSWNDKNFPQWSSWAALNGYFARGTSVLETGTAKTDVAVYSDSFLSPRGNQSPFDAHRLEEQGFSVEYLDPQGLARDSRPANGELFPRTSGYHALVVDQRAIGHDAAAAILRAAHAGVRIVFVGALPDHDTTFASGGRGDADVKNSVAETLKQPSAARVASQNDVAGALKRLGLAPRMASGGTQVLSQWREVKGGAYAYLYNPSDHPVTFTPSFGVQGVPSEMNLWNGTVSPLAQYTTGNGRTALPMTLQGREGKVIAIDKDARSAVHVVGSSAPEGGQLAISGGKIVFRATESGTQAFQLSTGRTVDVTTEVPDSDRPLSGPPSSRPSVIEPWSPWSLSVKSVTPTGGATVTVPSGLGDSQFQQFRLKDWRDITDLSGESGVGTYTANTVLPDGWRNAGGVQLDLGHVDGTADISVNGQLVGNQITDGRQWDIGRWLHPGTNTVQITVRTTLRNAVSKYNKKSTASQPYGLRGPVTLTPFRDAVVFGGR